MGEGAVRMITKRRGVRTVADNLVCWKCGATLEGLPLPLGRLAECRACGADLHVCRLCKSYDPRVRMGCDEPRAEEVRDREKANFCDYFQPRQDAFKAFDDSAARKAKAELEALFGVESPRPAPEGPPQDPAGAESDAAREQLHRLFGPGDDGKK